MSRPPSPPASPPLVSLVLHSKKALQHGEQLCTRASEISRCSSQEAVELLALDAKVRWIAQGIQDQLKLAVSVARSIETQKDSLQYQVKQWDASRMLHSRNLDAILESLGSQVVPPDFHQTSSSSSVFGSPSDEDDSGRDENNEERTKKKTIVPKHQDRNRWKTLRDFVDERGIEDAMENMDNDRHALDDLLSTTAEYPQLIRNNAQAIRESIPSVEPVPSIQMIFNDQERVSTDMASHLESLAAHYDQMAAALRDKESGADFTEEDLQDMNRDTDELPAIIRELEDDVMTLESSCNQIQAAKLTSERSVVLQNEVIGSLDALGDMLFDMLHQQQSVENECQTHMETLHTHLSTLAGLRMTYTSYQASYNNLVLEMDRRRQYRDAAEDIVHQMGKQLDALREQEIQTRELFYASHGPHLPDDLCLSVTNLPTKWEVGPGTGECNEILPVIDEDLLEDARRLVLLNQAGDGSL